MIAYSYRNAGLSAPCTIHPRQADIKGAVIRFRESTATTIVHESGRERTGDNMYVLSRIVDKLFFIQSLLIRMSALNILADVGNRITDIGYL